MNELIERLEKATGPDRELDAAIFRAIHPDWRTEGHNKVVNFQFLEPIEHYTASIDAALTLVPEGCQWDLLTRGNSFRSDVWKPNVLRDTPPKQVRHPVAAIALCIAALKARAASITNG